MQSSNIVHKIWLNDRVMFYEVRDIEAGEFLYCWSLPVDVIRLIGEYIRPNNASSSGHSLIFVFDFKPDWYEVSFHSTGCEILLQQLGILLGGRLTAELSYSLDFNSRVIWPPKVEGYKLFNFEIQEGEKSLPTRRLFKFSDMVDKYLSGSFSAE
jgi:hypothetical protein